MNDTTTNRHTSTKMNKNSIKDADVLYKYMLNIEDPNNRHIFQVVKQCMWNKQEKKNLRKIIDNANPETEMKKGHSKEVARARLQHRFHEKKFKELSQEFVYNMDLMKRNIMNSAKSSSTTPS